MSLILDEAFARLAELRAEFALVRQAAYDRAAEATRGAMLNERGRRAGIDAFDLFRSNEATAVAYASPELLEHWHRYPRLTFDQYELQMMERET